MLWNKEGELDLTSAVRRDGKMLFWQVAEKSEMIWTCTENASRHLRVICAYAHISVSNCILGYSECCTFFLRVEALPDSASR